MRYYIFKSIENEIKQIAEDIYPTNTSAGIERLHTFITKIYQIQTYKESRYGFMEEEEESEKHAYLSSAQLRCLLSNDNITIIEVLEEAGLLNITRKRTDYGDFFKIFHLPPTIMNSPRHNATNRDTRVKAGLARYYKLKKNKLKGVDSLVFKMLCKMKINITKEQLKIELTNKYPSYVAQKLEYISSIASKDDLDKGVSILTQGEYVSQYHYYHNYISFWNESTALEKLSYMGVDSFGYRFHSIFTILPSFVRNYTYTKGMSNFVGLDLNQSQPTILAKLLFDAKGNNSFTNTVNEGDVYSKYHLTRKNAKKQFLTSIFSPCDSRAVKELSLLYPILGQYICESQQVIMYREEKLLETEKNTSCLLQRKESQIFRKVWRKLLRAKIDFLPIHDAIYIDVCNKERAMEIMTGVLQKELHPINFGIS